LEKRGYEIGKRDGGLYRWESCPCCNKDRWVKLKRGQPISVLCIECKQKGVNNKGWKGGITSHQGYRQVRICKEDFFFPMASLSEREKTCGVVLEHRLVMARHLNRCLLPWEIVHHKNGIKDDNELENLELLPHGRFHLSDNNLKAQIIKLKKQSEKLRKVIWRLQQQTQNNEMINS